MLHSVFSVHDIKAGAYLPPFILPKSAMAIRIFSDCINSKDHQFGQHPQDYTLFCLGSFDDERGQYILLPSAESLGNGVEFVKPSGQDDLFAREGDSNAEEEEAQQQISDETPVQSGAKGRNSKE